MLLSRESNNAKYQITSYTASSITINKEQVFKKSIIITPQYLEPWNVNNIANLTITDLEQLIVLKPELILLGTGPTMAFPQPELLNIIYAAKIGIEVMPTNAACRTYAALSSEGRNVLAALIICT